MYNYAYQDGSKYPFPPAIFLAIAILSIISSWATNAAISWAVSATIDVSDFQGVSALLFFGLYYMLFDSYLWKWGLLRAIRIVSTLNLEGEWNSDVVSSLSEYPIPLHGKLRIHQTYSNLSITFKTKISRSSTLWAVITPVDQETIELTYQFSAKRDVDSLSELSEGERYRSDPDRWKNHEGTAQIFFYLEKGKGRPQSGTYYTNSDHGRRGDIQFGGEITEAIPSEPKETNASKDQ